MKFPTLLAIGAILASASAQLHAREWLLQDGVYYDLSSPRSPPDRSGHYERSPDLDTEAFEPISPGPKSDALALRIKPVIEKREIPWAGAQAPGTIVISTEERRLRLVLPGQKALEYGIGVGREGFSWKGAETITRKAQWPGWTPPAEMRQRRPDLPRHMEGGIRNPLGARALYLGTSLYRIHGTNEPNTIGNAVSSGCIRMSNPDVIDLYNRASVGALVIVE